MAMTDDPKRVAELETALWKAIDESPFMMVGLQGVEDSRTRPMTAQVDAGENGKAKEGGQIYFFGAKSEALVQGLGQSKRANATFVSKDHKIFAHIHGTLRTVNDPALVERLWNPFVASWYKDGKDDPDLALIRFDTEKADVWESHQGTTLKAALLSTFGRQDPGKEEQQENQAEVTL
jgi:general stress protein 26